VREFRRRLSARPRPLSRKPHDSPGILQGWRVTPWSGAGAAPENPTILQGPPAVAPPARVTPWSGAGAAPENPTILQGPPAVARDPADVAPENPTVFQDPPAVAPTAPAACISSRSSGVSESRMCPAVASPNGTSQRGGGGGAPGRAAGDLQVARDAPPGGRRPRDPRLPVHPADPRAPGRDDVQAPAGLPRERDSDRGARCRAFSGGHYNARGRFSTRDTEWFTFERPARPFGDMPSKVRAGAPGGFPPTALAAAPEAAAAAPPAAPPAGAWVAEIVAAVLTVLDRRAPPPAAAASPGPSFAEALIEEARSAARKTSTRSPPEGSPRSPRSGRC
jgi:hypothetical protein